MLVSYNPYGVWLRSFDPPLLRALGYELYYRALQSSWEVAPLWRYFVFPVRQQPVLITALRHPGAVLAVNVLALALLGWSIAKLRSAR